ncbi:hypothetical protein D3C80_1843880 [compost metagenome]
MADVMQFGGYEIGDHGLTTLQRMETQRVNDKVRKRTQFYKKSRSLNKKKRKMFSAEHKDHKYWYKSSSGLKRHASEVDKSESELSSNKKQVLEGGKSKSVRKCSACGQVGHNKANRNCPKNKTE